MTPILVLPASLSDALLVEAMASPQAEICGLIAVRGKVWIRYRMANRAAEPARRFELDGGELIAAFKHMRTTTAFLRAIYHSHPDGAPHPSPHDVRGHHYPAAAALIAAPRARANPLAAWRLTGAAPRPLPLYRMIAPWREGFL